MESMIENSKINEITKRIVEKCNPEKIILFGSYASGNVSEDSDLDLLVIQETDLPHHKRGLDIYKSLIGTMVPIDVLVYTQQEFEKEIRNNYSFLNSAMKSSRILYERKKQYNTTMG